MKDWDAVLRAGVEPPPPQQAHPAFTVQDPGQKERSDKDQKEYEQQLEDQKRRIREAAVKKNSLKQGPKR